MRISALFVIFGLLLSFAVIPKVLGGDEEIDRVLTRFQEMVAQAESGLPHGFRLQSKARFDDFNAFVASLKGVRTNEHLLAKLKTYEKKRPEDGAKLRAEMEELTKKKGKYLRKSFST